MNNTNNTSDARYGQNNNQMGQNWSKGKVKNISCDIDMNIINILGSQRKSKPKKKDLLNQKRPRDSYVTNQEGYKNESNKSKNDISNMSNSINNSFFSKVQGQEEKSNCHNDRKLEDIWSHGTNLNNFGHSKNLKNLPNAISEEELSYCNDSEQKEGWSDYENQYYYDRTSIEKQKKMLDADSEEELSCCNDSEQKEGWSDYENQYYYDHGASIEKQKKMLDADSEEELSCYNNSEQKEGWSDYENQYYYDRTSIEYLNNLGCGKNQKNLINIDENKKRIFNRTLSKSEINKVLKQIESYIKSSGTNNKTHLVLIDLVCTQKLDNNQINKILKMLMKIKKGPKGYLIECLLEKYEMNKTQIDVILGIVSRIDIKVGSYVLDCLIETQKLDRDHINQYLEMSKKFGLKTRSYKLEGLLKFQYPNKIQINVILEMSTKLGFKLQKCVLESMFMSKTIKKEQFDFVAIWKMLKKSDLKCVMPKLLQSRLLTRNRIKAILIMLIIFLKKDKKGAQKKISNALKELVDEDKKELADKYQKEELTDEQFEIILGTEKEHPEEQMGTELQKSVKEKTELSNPVGKILVTEQKTSTEQIRTVLQKLVAKEKTALSNPVGKILGLEKKLSREQICTALQKLVNGEEVSKDEFENILGRVNQFNLFEPEQIGYMLRGLVSNKALPKFSIPVILSIVPEFDQKILSYWLTVLLEEQCLTPAQINTVLTLVKSANLGEILRSNVLTDLVQYQQLSKEQIAMILEFAKNLCDKKSQSYVLSTLVRCKKPLSETQIDMILALAKDFPKEWQKYLLKYLAWSRELSEEQINTILKLTKELPDEEFQSCVLTALIRTKTLSKEQINMILELTKKLRCKKAQNFVLRASTESKSLSETQIDIILEFAKNFYGKWQNRLLTNLARSQKLSKKQIDTILQLTKNLDKQAQSRIIPPLASYGEQLSEPQLNTILKLARECELDKKLENCVIQCLQEKRDLRQKQINKISKIKKNSNQEITNDKSNNVQNSTENETKKLESEEEQINAILKLTNRFKLDKKLENYVIHRLHEKRDLRQKQINKISKIKKNSNQEITNDKSNNVQNLIENETKKLELEEEQNLETPQTIKLSDNNKMPLLNDLLNFFNAESKKSKLQSSISVSQSEEKSRDKNNLTFSNNETVDISRKSILDRMKTITGTESEDNKVPNVPEKQDDFRQDNNI